MTYQEANDEADRMVASLRTNFEKWATPKNVADFFSEKICCADEDCPAYAFCKRADGHIAYNDECYEAFLNWANKGEDEK